MTIEDKSRLPPFSSKDKRDEKGAQEELARLRKRLQKNENGALKTPHKWTGLKDKTLWDWMQLLIIPLVLAVGGFLLSAYQHNADQQRALDQQQAAILQTYVDNIQDLLLNHNLQISKPDDEIAILARARTLTALEGLDPDRKSRLVQFLYEAQLIGFLDVKLKRHDQIIDLRDANLNEVTLVATTFSGADLSHADLGGADLSGADLRETILTQEQLDHAFSCTNATLPKGLICNKNP